MKLNFLIIFSLIILFSCKPHREAKLIKFAGEAQGTYYAVTYFDAKGRNFQNDIDSLLKDFDQTASMWVENSIISKINRNEPDVVVDEVFTALFEMSKDVYVKSEGAFDPTIGPLVNAWGFGPKGQMGAIDTAQIKTMLTFVDFKNVKIENGIVKKKFIETYI